MDQSQEKQQSILAHLSALRNVLVVSAIAVFAAFIVIFYAAIDPLMHLITQPIVDRGIEVIYTAMSEALMTKLKVALIAAVVAASPVIFWQIWKFIKPALYPHEKKAFRLIFFVAVAVFSSWLASRWDGTVEISARISAAGNTEQKEHGGTFKLTPDMLQMVGSFTILRMSGMVGMVGITLTEKDLLDLNRKLNKIRVPKK